MTRTPKPPRKPPVKPKRPLVEYPDLNFARQFDMLTDDEIEACLTGNAEVKGHTLFNVNADDLTFPTGCLEHLYPNRRLDKIVDQLLNINQGSE